MGTALIHRLASGVAILAAVAACNASLSGPAQLPAKSPSTLDTGTPARANVALASEPPARSPQARGAWAEAVSGPAATTP